MISRQKSGQASSQRPQTIQSSGRTAIALNLFISNTFLGQTSTQMPHPLHHSTLILISLTFLDALKIIPPFKLSLHLIWLIVMSELSYQFPEFNGGLNHISPYCSRSLNRTVPTWPRLSITVMPAACMALILSVAIPFPPAMIAPA